jgi:hypothetical protein
MWYKSEMHLFFYPEQHMINKTAVIDAEKNLFNSMLSGKIFEKNESEISRIIETYANDDEIKNIMEVFELTFDDFKIIYKYLLHSSEISGLIFLDEVPCLMATAVMLDIDSLLSMANRIYCSLPIKQDRYEVLIDSAYTAAHIFFMKHAVMQNVVSIQYFCRNGICRNLR